MKVIFTGFYSKNIRALNKWIKNLRRRNWPGNTGSRKSSVRSLLFKLGCWRILLRPSNLAIAPLNSVGYRKMFPSESKHHKEVAKIISLDVVSLWSVFCRRASFSCYVSATCPNWDKVCGNLMSRVKCPNFERISSNIFWIMKSIYFIRCFGV